MRKSTDSGNKFVMSPFALQISTGFDETIEGKARSLVEEQKFVTPLSHLKALGLEVSLLIGLGKTVSLEETRGLIESGRVLESLQKDHGVDLHVWKRAQIDEIATEYQSMTSAIDEMR